jgi:hypothetical protein
MFVSSGIHAKWLCRYKETNERTCHLMPVFALGVTRVDSGVTGQ